MTAAPLAPVTIGLCYDLKDDYLAMGYSREEAAEFDSPVTVAAIEEALRAAGRRVVRVGNARSLMARLVAGERWDLVFNIAEGLSGAARESQVPCILDVYGIPATFSDAAVLALCLDKGLCKRVLRDMGLQTAGFYVARSVSECAAEGVTGGLRYPLFAKPVAEGTSKGVTARSLANSAKELKTAVRSLLARHGQPVLVERYLPGREFTVGLLGTGQAARVLGVLEVGVTSGDAEGYTYDNKQRFRDCISYTLVDDETARRAADMALEAWRALGCRDAGRVDLRCDRHGYPKIMELNPLPGLHPEDSDLPILCRALGMPYQELIAAIADSALERIGSRPARRCA